MTCAKRYITRKVSSKSILHISNKKSEILAGSIMGTITAIAGNDVHRITSGQVIIDLTTAVKELVDNSIDAHANHIEIVFKNYGIESVECSDDGDGIGPENFESLALKHYTSKISSFQDVSSVETLGFRGEALASLCAIANVSVITTTNPPRADKLEYDINGSLASKSTTSRNKGTTVQVSQLFNNLPVRKKEFERSSKRHFSKCIALLQDYALVQNGIKFSVWHLSPNRKRTLVLSTGKDQEMSKNILSVFGSSSMRGLAQISLELDLNTYNKQSTERLVIQPELDYKIKVRGYISKNSFGCGRNSKDRQSIFINKRPIEYPVIIQCCNEIYRTFNNVQYPAVFLNFEISPELIDVNVTPDKRTILLHNERYVIDLFKEKLTEYYDTQELELPKSSCSQPAQPSLKRRRTELDIADSTNEDDKNNHEHEQEADQGSYRKELASEARNHQTYDKVSTLGSSEEQYDEQQKNIVNTTVTFTAERDDHSNHRNFNKTNNTEILIVDGKIEDTSQGFAGQNKERENRDGVNTSLNRYKNPSNERDTELEEKEYSASQPVLVEIDGSKLEYQATLSQDEKLVFISDDLSTKKCCGTDRHPTHEKHEGEKGEGVGEEEEYDGYDEEVNSVSLNPVEMNVRSRLPINSYQKNRTNKSWSLSDESNVHSQVEHVTYSLKYDNEASKSSPAGDLIVNNHKEKHANSILKSANIEDKEQGEKYLTLTVRKEDFKKMQVVGQFNLGFIIVTRRIGAKYDLFIVDQHASDEKYNFEVLQRENVFKSQSLIAPFPVELSVIDELLVMDNLTIFEKNGFKLSVGEEESQGSKIKLFSLPVSKRTLFDINDFYELVYLVKESGGLNRDSIRCSKIRSMFAMRACRTSIMIGKPLAKKTMTKVVRHLSELQKPWNCPHGRPTMRHLMELKHWDPFTKDYEL